MRWSHAWIPTLKEAPKEAITPSHVWLLRAGYIRMVGAGIYDLLPLGMRVVHKISAVVRAEMDANGGQELALPVLLPSNYLRESGRWEGFGAALFRLQDRRGGDYHLGPTHEEIVTDLIRRDLRSYKQLPLLVYQLQRKFRDEPRPRAGLLRAREFLMKDAYSFDKDDAAAAHSFAQMRASYCRIFARLGLRYAIVAADSGAMGGHQSAEFQILTQQGEDAIVTCDQCGYAANTEVAVAMPTPKASQAGEKTDDVVPPCERVETPEAGDITAVVKQLGPGISAAQLIKSLLYLVTDADQTLPTQVVNADSKRQSPASRRAVLVLTRGDRAVHPHKLARALGSDTAVLAPPAVVAELTGAPAGFVGPVGFAGDILADSEVMCMGAAIVGGNAAGVYLRHVLPGRDFQPRQVADLHTVVDGDPCPQCGAALQQFRSIEGGHIFILGTHYSERMRAHYVDAAGVSQPVVMGCYGIGISRLLAAAVEQHHDSRGICWPQSMAPYQVLLLSLGEDPEVIAAAQRLYEGLQQAGIDCLWDDRRERPGAKFHDADLIGVPLRLIVGHRGLKTGVVELQYRHSDKDKETLPLTGCLDRIKALLSLG